MGFEIFSFVMETKLMFSVTRGATCQPADAPAELFARRFDNDYEDLRIITSPDDHDCTLDRLVGIY